MSGPPYPVPRSEWGPGPWQDEPDRVEFEHAGLPCLAVRNHYGAWCGYAAVPPGHPLHGKRHHEVEGDIDVHGGLNYSAACQEYICHTPPPGEPDDVWWFGFDCSHFRDFAPAEKPLLDRLKHRPVDMPESFLRFFRTVYRDLDYVTREIKSLAEQLVNVK